MTNSRTPLTTKQNLISLFCLTVPYTDCTMWAAFSSLQMCLCETYQCVFVIPTIVFLWIMNTIKECCIEKKILFRSRFLCSTEEISRREWHCHGIPKIHLSAAVWSEVSIQRVHYTKTTLPPLGRLFSCQPLSAGALPTASTGIHHWMGKKKKSD